MAPPPAIDRSVTYFLVLEVNDRGNCGADARKFRLENSTRFNLSPLSPAY